MLAAVFAMSTLAVTTVWGLESRRSRERELLTIGREMKAAIGRYYESSPGTVKVYPRELQDLLEDKRFLGVRRHLRKIPFDPLTRQRDWGLVLAPGGAIMGVYSLSDRSPLNKATFRVGEETFALAQTYRDWRFEYVASE